MKRCCFNRIGFVNWLWSTFMVAMTIAGERSRGIDPVMVVMLLICLIMVWFWDRKIKEE